MRKDVPPISEKTYNDLKTKTDTLTNKVKFRTLLLVANLLPYDKHICMLLAEKFEAMEMPRCASIMKLRANENDKLKINKTVVKVTTEDKNIPPNKQDKQSKTPAKQNKQKKLNLL